MTMDPTVKNVTKSQVKVLMEFMRRNKVIDKGVLNTGLEKEEVDAQWQDITDKLNSMGGVVKSVDKWKKTWRNLKWNSKKRAMKQNQSLCDTSLGMCSSDGTSDTMQNTNEFDEPTKRKQVSFDEEIVKIERDKLDMEREYKIQKIEVLTRIAAALEELANK